jgi:hypothetical protein
MALKLAKFAVNTTPSEFLTWAKLTEGKNKLICVHLSYLLNVLFLFLYSLH